MMRFPFIVTCLLLAVVSNGAAINATELPIESFASLSMADISTRLASVETELDELNGVGGSQGHVKQKSYGTCGRQGLIASVDFLYLRPHRSGLDFAIADPNTDNNIEGPVQALGLDGNIGVRGSIGYATGNGWDFGLVYTHFDSNDQLAVTAPAGGRLWLTRTNPASFNNHADQATATASLNYDLFDIEAGRYVNCGPCVPIRLFGGFRAATIKQENDIFYSGGTIAPPARDQRHSMQVDAYGLRGGAEVQWILLQRLRLFGRAAGSVLIGDHSLSYIEDEQQFGGQGGVNVSYNYTEVIPMLEAACGVSWETGSFSWQAGYELTALMNLDSRLVFSGAETINRGQMSYASKDLVLEGFFLRAAYNY